MRPPPGRRGAATSVREAAAARALGEQRGSRIVIAGSDMLSGGRALHHFKALAPDRRNTILCVGYQAAGTRGAALVCGARAVHVQGEDVPVRAEVVQLGGLSAHADAAQIVQWLRGFEAAPRMTFVTHGAPFASAALARSVERELGWRCVVPEYLDRFDLPATGALREPSALDAPADACGVFTRRTHP